MYGGELSFQVVTWREGVYTHEPSAGFDLEYYARVKRLARLSKTVAV
jgi:hypothetical protein